MGEIAYQNKDIASKVTGEALVGRSLAPFGRPDLEIVGVLPFVKYINYVARVVKRYADQKKLGELKQIKMVVIYTADVEQADSVYDLDGLTLKVEPAYLVHMDTERIYQELEKKVLHNEKLTDEELMKLMVLPLTVKGKEKKQEVIVKAVELAKQIPDRSQSIQVLAGILTFSDKVIDEAYRNRVKEEMQMTKVGQMIFEDGFGQGIEQGIEQGIQALVVSFKDEGFSREQIVRKIQTSFSVDEQQAQTYFDRFSR